MSGRGRFKEIRPRIRSLPVSRIRPMTLPPEILGDGGRAERLALYSSKRWAGLRRRYLATSCKRCFFCDDGTPAVVLEHVIGHGDDAAAVAAALGLPFTPGDWRARFWQGPFVGSCMQHARQRSGYEASGRLLVFTDRWLEDRRTKSG